MSGKKKLLTFLGIFLVLAVAFATAYTVYYNLSSKNVLYVYVDGEEVCEIFERGEFSDLVSTVEKYKSEIGIESDAKLSCEYKSVHKSNPLSLNEALDKVCSKIFTGYVRGYAVTCNGTRLAVCLSYSDAENTIAELKSTAEKNISIIIGSDNISLDDDFEIQSIICQRSSVLSLDEIYDSVVGNTESDSSQYGFASNTVITNKTSSLNTYSSLINSYGLPRSSDGSGSGIGVTYGNTGADVNFSTVTTQTYTEIIDFDIKYTESKKLYVGETKISQAGENGLVKKTIETITSPDGRITRNVISEEIIIEPKTQIELKGTKNYPSTKPTGTFIFPIQDWYSISSYYGVKRGKLDGASGHHGIDIALSSGHKIYAADGGTVIWAGERGTYGNLVIIQHEDTVQTYYGHMSEILVSEGDYIYKGQVIGLVGMTGRATGPHLHFEVRINGKTVDPLKYLP